MVEEAPPSYMATTDSSARPRSRQRLTCLFRRRNSRSSRLHPFPEKTLNDETNMEKAFMEQARLGLIGDNIAASQAPRLHALAGALQRIAVRYDLLVPAELGLGFDALFDRCADGSYHGINVTHPYKERAAARVEIENPLVRAMGAVNLVRFAPDRPRGFNTDYTGFLSAYRAKFGIEAPGIVCQVGAGGAGKAIGFCAGRARGGRDPDRGHRPRPGASAGGGASVRVSGAGRSGGREPGRSGRGSARPRQLFSGRHGRPRWDADSAYALARGGVGVRRGLYPGPHAISGRCGGGRARHRERLRALLPPGGGRFRDLLRRYGRSGSAPAGGGRVWLSACCLALRYAKLGARLDGGGPRPGTPLPA